MIIIIIIMIIIIILIITTTTRPSARIHRATTVTLKPIGALGIISKNAKSWYGRLSLSDIFGSTQFSAIHVTAHI